jgi:HD-GYP domain-containing protein (c-di-GMP phosphodiesterase class II)
LEKLMDSQSISQLSKANYILKITEELNSFKEIDTILDRILFESRKLANADAGSIFLIENNALKFSYVHNDTFYHNHSNNKYIYSNFSVPLNDKSIVGYAALTGKTIIIDNAYELSGDLPYHFDNSYDIQSGYKTHSMMTIPLRTFQGKIVGVMQIINSKCEENESCIPFTKEIETYISFFARHACLAIERGIMTRELILRMMKMAELRDPKETGAHVQRVGAYSAEIYHKWALNRGLDIDLIKKHKGLIRLASMLHDVGKVGISDAILKKPGRLTKEEFDQMKYHTIKGERLFNNSASELDILSKKIALNHHEKWNGKGYPGKTVNNDSEYPEMGVGKVGEEIPIEARITALADVFDALGSVRSYKDRWPDYKVLDLIKSESGEHFDPEVVTAFFEIIDVIKAIRDKFTMDKEESNT